jgi:hypothetical protein
MSNYASLAHRGDDRRGAHAHQNRASAGTGSPVSTDRQSVSPSRGSRFHDGRPFTASRGRSRRGTRPTAAHRRRDRARPSSRRRCRPAGDDPAYATPRRVGPGAPTSPHGHPGRGAQSTGAGAGPSPPHRARATRRIFHDSASFASSLSSSASRNWRTNWANRPCWRRRSASNGCTTS